MELNSPTSVVSHVHAELNKRLSLKGPPAYVQQAPAMASTVLLEYLAELTEALRLNGALTEDNLYHLLRNTPYPGAL